MNRTTNRPRGGKRPSTGATGNYRENPTVRGRVTRGHAGFLMLGAVAVLAALLLTATPVRAQETSEATAPETEAGPKVDEGRAEPTDGGRSVRIGDGCVVVEDEGGEDLAVGSCDEGGGDGDDGHEETVRNDEPSTPGRTVLERAAPERTVAEETAPEETAPEATDVEESAVPEDKSPEETEPEDGAQVGAECPTEPEGETFETTVGRAVDGDTLELYEPVDGVWRVRLIGVDAPEMEGESGEPEPYAEEAAGFTASELEGERVLLQLDEETVDPYGRLLAYVWREEATPGQERRWPSGGEGPELFNLTLLEGGYAAAMSVEPNTGYAGCFAAVERAAREEGSGLWGAGEGPDDEQYTEETVPESTTPESTPTADTAPERTLPEETSPEGPSGEEELPGMAPASDDADRPEEELPEATEATEEPTTPGLSQGTGEEAVEGPYDQYEESYSQYEEPEEQTAVEATVPEITATPSVPEGGAEIAVEAKPVASAPALPTRQTPAGPVPVLPETGGAAILPLFLGVACSALGALLLDLLRRGWRRGGARSDER